MPFKRLGLIVLLVAAAPLAAKPLVTSSEETLARLCLARTEAPDRVAAACDAALSDAGLTLAQRVDLMTARGDALSWQELWPEAIAAFRAATALDARAVDAWNGLGWALWETKGEDAAYAAFETSINAGVSVQGLGGKAATARRTGRLPNAEARSMLRAALAIDPDYAWALREIAWSFLEDGLNENAALEFEAALDIDPDDSNALYGLGRVRLSMGDAGDALGHFDAVLRLVPGDFAAEVYRIVALRELDRNAQALRDADRLIAAWPDRSSGYIEKGKALLALERRREAIETYRQAETILGPNNALLYWYADALTIDGRYGEAMEVIDRGLALDGADYSDHLMKSYIALAMEDYPAARAAAEASLATGVDDPWAHYYIAISMIHGGETAAGLDRFARAMETGLPPDRVGAFARELIGAGKYVEAAQLRMKY